MDLPTEIVSEIFSRSSLSTVGKFRTLSRACNSETYSSNFSKNFTDRTDSVSGFFVQDVFLRHPHSFISPNDSAAAAAVNLKFLPCEGIHIWAAAKPGFLLCENAEPSPRRFIPEYYVCKPTTRQWQKIPNPKTRYATEAMGMVVLRSDPLWYKIVRFSRPKVPFKEYKSKSYYTLHCEVYDSTARRWRKFEDEVRLSWSGYIDGHGEPAVSAAGVLYWLTFDRRVLAFHASCAVEGEGDHWRVMNLAFPLTDENYYRRVRLAEYCGRLGVVCEGRGFFDLWVMEDGGGGVWSKRMRVSGDGAGYPVGFFGSDVVLARASADLTCHNMMNGGVEKFGLAWDYGGNDGVFQFESDFEPVKVDGGGSTGAGSPTLGWFLFC